jgi:hypothetical protein
MSEAGLLVAKPERQWRPAKHGSKRKRGAVGNGTYRWKALRILENGGVGAPPAEGVLVLLEEAGKPVDSGGTTGGVRNQLIGLVEADNADTGCCSGDRVPPKGR